MTITAANIKRQTEDELKKEEIERSFSEKQKAMRDKKLIKK